MKALEETWLSGETPTTLTTATVVNQGLDYALLQGRRPNADESRTVAPIDWDGCFGDLRIFGMLLLGDSIHVIQHPRGGPKMVVEHSDLLGTPARVMDRVEHILAINANVLKGSSGSPVYKNENNKVCGMVFGGGLPQLFVNLATNMEHIGDDVYGANDVETIVENGL